MKKAQIIALACIILGGCDDPNRPMPIPLVSSTSPIPVDPMSTFCGPTCALCGYSQAQCLGVLEANLSDLCDNKTENCYLKWKQYARTCRTICTNMQKVDHDIRTTNAMAFFTKNLR